MTSSVPSRVRLIQLLLTDPLPTATVHHGRLLAGTALFVIAAKSGVQLTGTGGFGVANVGLPPAAHSLMDIVIAALGIRFLSGVSQALLQVYIQWQVQVAETGLPTKPAAQTSFDRTRTRLLELLANRKFSGPVVWLSLVLAGFVLVTDAIAPMVLGAIALRSPN